MNKSSYGAGPSATYALLPSHQPHFRPGGSSILKLGLGVLTLINVALTCFGVSMAMMSPMLFDAGGEQDQLLWAMFWGIFVFPAVAFVCVFVPWLFLWLRWPRTALFAAAIPVGWLMIVVAVIFIRY